MLRNYQIDIANAAADMLKKHKIAYLNMQVRTGKTITSLQTVLNCGYFTVLFVTKKKAISSIADDYNKFFKDKMALYVTNYENLHNLDMPKPDVVIIDEAHSLGAFPKPSLRTIQLKKICEGLPIIYLSGTPSPESYSQLYHQFWVSSYSPFRDYTNFYKWANVFVTIKTKYLYNREMRDYTYAKQEQIEAFTKHLFISFTQEEAGFKELVSETIHRVKMQPMTYDLIAKLKRDRVVTGITGTIEADTEVKLLNKLHQLYSGSVILDDKEEPVIIDQSKMEYILRYFKGKKIAIFYKFKAEASLISLALLGNGYTIAQTPEEFNKADNACAYISQFVSGREGINLSGADCLICFNIDFSAITYFQVRARLQTKDRVNSAEVHWIFAENGIEDKIYQAVSNKKNYTLNYFKKDAGIRTTTKNYRLA